MTLHNIYYTRSSPLHDVTSATKVMSKSNHLKKGMSKDGVSDNFKDQIKLNLTTWNAIIIVIMTYTLARR